MEENHQTRVLVRLNDINDFISSSILKTDELLHHENKYDLKVDQTLTPMTMNVHRAMEAIGKFHMNHPLSNESSGFLKLRRNSESGNSNNTNTQ